MCPKQQTIKVEYSFANAYVNAGAIQLKLHYSFTQKAFAVVGKTTNAASELLADYTEYTYKYIYRRTKKYRIDGHFV